jgi:cell wall-associated NlpC family hydrolase
VCHPAFNEEGSRFIVMGSSLPSWDGMSCHLAGSTFIYNGQATPVGGMEYNPEVLIKVIKRYLFCPELSGGRTPFGIDAGAFVQQVMRIFGKSLPRWVHEQAAHGEWVHFSELSREGDLAYCCDEDGKIIHAGIMISSTHVAHVHGEVRIDPLDHFGIFNKSRKRYTHLLRIIKRVL